MAEDGSRTRERLVVEAAGPLAAAVQGFLHSSGSLPETIEVDPLTVLVEPARLAVTVVSSEGTRFRIGVTLDSLS